MPYVKRQRVAVAPVETVPLVGPPRPVKTRPAHAGRWALAAAVLAVGFIGFVALRGSSNSSTSSSGSGASSGSNDLPWQGLQLYLSDHTRTFDQNVAAGNAQGALNARTKIVADCQLGRGLPSGGSTFYQYSPGFERGGSAAEQAVRSQCQAAGYPIP